MPLFPQNSTERNLLRAALGGASVAILSLAVLTAGSARAEDAAPERFFDGVMSAIGLQKERRGIDYHERSPLVVPRGNTLPPPQASAAKDPNWPVDPEVKQAKALATPDDGLTSSQRMDQNMLPLLPSEIERGRTSARQNNPGVSSDGVGLPSKWSDLGYKGGLFSNMFGGKDEETAKFTGEPPRTSLITPPSGYQTPSPNQPYGLSKDKYKPKASDYYGEYGKLKQ
jgi:hypothetical protein